MQVLPSRTGPKGLDAGHYLRLLAWGAGAVLAITLAVAAVRTELGTERAHLALSDVLGTRPVAKDESSQFVAWSNAVDAQIRRQADVIRDLGEQRDGLADKVAFLERQVTELNGTLSRALPRLDADAKTAREAATAASSSAAAAAASARLAEARQAMEPTGAVPAVPTIPSATVREGAMVATPTRTVTTLPAHASHEVSAPLNLLPYNQIPGQIPGLVMGESGFGSAASVPAYTGTIPTPNSEPVVPPAAVPAPAAHPTPPIPVPLPLPIAASRTASVEPPGAVSPTRGGAKPQPVTAQLPQLQSNPLMMAGILNGPIEASAIGHEFAVDLGGAPTVEALRTRWNDLRANQSPLLDSLTPLVALKEGSQAGQELHLIAGPLASTTATARLCAVLTSSAVTCRPSVYEGQRLVR